MAECPYCTAHSCPFALRRGASTTRVARPLVGGEADFGRGELATIAVARSLGRVPCELTGVERDELIGVLGPARAEWIVADEALANDVCALAAAHGVNLDAAPGDPRADAALLLARAASPSPAPIDAAVVSACHDGGLAPAATVELVT